MNKNSFYVTVGGNGGIITDSYGRATYCKEYLRGHVYTTKFPDFTEAEVYLLDHLAEIAPWDCSLPECCKLNRMVTISKLRGG